MNLFDRSAMAKLMLKISLYYLCVALLLILAYEINPALIERLPVGGVSSMAGESAESIYDLEEALLNADEEDLGRIAAQQKRKSRFDDAKMLLVAMLGTLVLMLPVSWVYKRIHDEGRHDHSLDETALILPAVVAGIVLIVQHSLALAFSLAGIVAGVQFRRALSDTFDTLFIFVAIGVGIAAGIEALEIAAVLSIFFNYSALLVCMFGDGLESHYLSAKKQRQRERKAAQQATEYAGGSRDSQPD